MRLARLFSKIREVVRRVGAVRVTLALILLVLVGVFLRPGGLWDIWPKRYTSITITGNHTCGVLANGTLRCWGDTSRRPPPDERFITVAPGYGHACGLREDGSVSCWGTMDIHDGYSPYPGPEVGRGPFTSITAGFSHYCGLRADGSVVCWGSDESTVVPPEGERFTSISAGHHDTCGLRVDGSAWCWGRHLNGLQTCSAPPDGTAGCWGRRLRPGQESASDDERFKAISVGSDFACAIHLDDDITCWGRVHWSEGLRWAWENGMRISAEKIEWTQDHITGPFTAVSSGESHVCALRSHGEVNCRGRMSTWSSNPLGIPLHGSEPASNERFVSISSGSLYSCALRQNGTAKCWGGTSANRSAPEE